MVMCDGCVTSFVKDYLKGPSPQNSVNGGHSVT